MGLINGRLENIKINNKEEVMTPRDRRQVVKACKWVEKHREESKHSLTRLCDLASIIFKVEYTYILVAMRNKLENKG